ncbi:MAG: diguanylate cyclase [Polyangiaceae bacterium]
MKVLLADDDPVTRTMLGAWLRNWGYQVLMATNGREAIAALESDPELRLGIIDWEMPEVDGPDVCRHVRGRKSDEYVYLMLLTARNGAEDVVNGLEAGADDYLTKPCNRHELNVRLRVGRRIIELQQALVAAREALRVEAMHDGMTGLLNRTAFLERMKGELSRSEREGLPLGVLMIDLDHFKQINDTNGHAAGDAVLKEVAKRVSGVLRSYDAVGRLGGEEFGVLLPQCSTEQSRLLAMRVLNAIRSEPIIAGTTTLNVTASIGACSTEQTVDRIPEALLAAADSALYRAKREGRNRVQVVIGTDWPKLGATLRPSSTGPIQHSGPVRLTGT